MSVVLAAQTLSRSVAKAMEFLMDARKNGFLDCIGTIKFICTMNDLFYIMNTGFKDKLEDYANNKFKVPLNLAAADYVLQFLDQATEYIKSLKLQGVNILKSSLKTGFLGFLMDISVVKSIYAEYVETGQLEKLATFHASQEPLEYFFGRIRSKCGNNTNPTVEQFKSAYRKILVNYEIEASVRANCLDNLNIYFISSAPNPEANEAEIEEVQENIEDIEHFTPNDNLFDAYKEATICKIASNIEQIIRNRANFECDLCLNVLNENEKVSIEIFDNQQYKLCVAAVYICKVSQKYFDIFRSDVTFNYSHLVETFQNEIDYENTFKNSDFRTHEGHKHYFVEYILREFIRIQATYIAKNLTLKEQEKLQRNLLNKRAQLRN